jgi:two-component system LytT family response regulator
MKNFTYSAYLVDDEHLAIERLERLLAAFPQVQIAGSSTDPAKAIQDLTANCPDILFLDIQMPGINGFELLARLPKQPFVIFTTAFDEYALKAFEVNSIDYLLKPVSEQHLSRALSKLTQLRPVTTPDWLQKPELHSFLQELAASLRPSQPEFLRRVATRTGERISFLELDSVTHIIAKDKLTFAVVNGRSHCIDQTISDLERRLDPARFLRIHRAILVNVEWIQELNPWFTGKVMLTLKDSQHTQLPVARDRVRQLKTQMGI